MAKRWWKVLGGVAVPLAAMVALYSPPAAAQNVIRTPADPAAWSPRSIIGNAVLLGGGFGDFTGDVARNATGLNGGWGLKYVAGTRSLIGGELSYQGTANGLNATTVDDDYLLGTTFDAAVRAGFPIPLNSAFVAPFIYGGAGWTRYDLVNESELTGILTRETDDQFTIPMGLGFAAGYRGFIAEARGTYRQAFDEELFGGDQDMSTWGVSLSIGGEF